MDRDRNRKIEELFHATADQPAHLRSAFLENACPNDATLRGDVQSLLTADDSGNCILDTPACDVVLGAVFPVRRLFAPQPHVCLVQEGRGLQRMLNTLPAHEPLR